MGANLVEMVGCIESHLVEYIIVSTKQFRSIEEVLEGHIGDRSWEIPKIKM